MPRFRFLALAAPLCLACAAPALAHPHVWVDYQLTLLFDNGKISALQQDWLFDDEFTTSVMNDVAHHKGNAPFTAGEVAKLRQSAFSNLKGYDYFTHVWAGGKPVKLGVEAKDFEPTLEGDQLRYRFTLPLPQPVDPHAGAVAIGIWDDSYYVDVGPLKGKSPVLQGNGAAGCKAQIVEDADHPIYYGSINPQTVKVSC